MWDYCKTWDLIALRIHALLIGIVISPLGFTSGGIGWAACRSSAGDKAAAGANGSAGSRFSVGSADSSAEPGSHSGSNRRSTGKILIDGFTWGYFNALFGPLAADRIIGLKFLKRLARLRQNHDAWACRHGNTAPQDGRSYTYHKTSFHFHAEMISSIGWAG
jgi:hypothetical protein